MSKRTDYISWNQYFMELAKLSARRSKDPSTQVGAVIIGDENRIVSIGYNGFPRGCNDDIFPWTKDKTIEENKYLYVVHAEQNAIINSTEETLKGCTMYTTLFPCNDCAKLIIQCGINRVVYIEQKPGMSTLAAMKMFNHCNVVFEEYNEED